ncbi:MAG: AAA domain-containing protein [Gemmataceae bacterium]
MASHDEHFARLADLLEVESEAEARQVVERVRRLPPAEAEATGHSLVDLVVRDAYAGLGGRMLLTLGKRDALARLPWTRLGGGTPVVLSVQGARRVEGHRGVVSEREWGHVRVAFDEPPDEEGPGALYRLDVAPDEMARVRQRQALDRAAAAKRDRLAELRAALLGERRPEFEDIREVETLDSGLNASQRDAVRLALAAKDVAVLHGPPGTGKTTTVVEVVRQAVRRGWRVLVCAPSNLAVDNVLERLIAFGESAVRLGHPARVLPALREHTLDLLVERHDDAKLARKLVKEAFALFRQAGKWTRAKPEPGAKQSMRQEARARLTDARRLESHAVESVLHRATVVCATLTGLDAELIGKRRFDLLVIDEACQSTEPACWIPLALADRVVLAGDHCQLPPTVVSVEAARRGFAVSLMERLVALHGDAVTRRLDVQYRMHERIMAFSSQEFYAGSLVAHEGVKAHRLCDLPGVATTPRTEAPVTFIDTAGAGYDEELEPDGESRLNSQEAALAERKVRELLSAGVRAEDIAVIAPYAAQVRLLRKMLADVEGLEIDSVDGFQGREKEAVVLSLVRCNLEGEIGFLADIRRTNVALTRARRCLVVLGDSATLAHHPFYARMCEYFESVEGYRTVWEEMT